MKTFDFVVIGGGAAGLAAARTARHAGASVAIVSDAPLGGDCTFTGCVPSKALLAASRRGDSFTDAMHHVHTSIDRIAASENAELLRGEGVTVIEDRATLTSPTTIETSDGSITAKHIVIATGAKPPIPPIVGIDGVPFRTNENLFELDKPPARLGIIGGGAIGVEMATAFARFGTEVTIFEAADRLLPLEEAESSAVIEETFGAAGVECVTSTTVERVTASGRAEIHLEASPATFVVDELLIATGRRPSTAGMGLEQLGLRLKQDGAIEVDGKLRTNVKTVSAVGDVTGLLPFTHAADEQGRTAANHVLGRRMTPTYDAARTAWVTFSSPEVARVGLTEREAPAGARVAFLPLDHVDRAITDRHTTGFVKLIAAPRRLLRNVGGGRLIGASIVAERAGEMIYGPAMAIRLDMFVGRLAQVTAPYPTWTTAVQQAAGQFFQPVNGLVSRPAGRR